MYIDAVKKGYKLINVPVNENLREKLELKTNEELEQILKSLKNTHNKSDFDTRKRAIRAIEIEDYYKNNPDISLDYPKFNTLFIGIDVDRNTRRKRITNRLKARLEEGMIEEVEQLLKSGIAADDLIYYGLEYKFLTMYVIGKINRNDMFQKLESAIHQFAKRQMTWFR
jgi:tRNA dimethylallyltransferase